MALASRCIRFPEVLLSQQLLSVALTRPDRSKVSCACTLTRFSGSDSFRAWRTPQSMGFSRQEYWSGLPCPPPPPTPAWDLPNIGIEPTSLMSPVLAGRFFTTSATREANRCPVEPGSAPHDPQLCRNRAQCFVQFQKEAHEYKMMGDVTKLPGTAGDNTPAERRKSDPRVSFFCVCKLINLF